MQHGKIGYNNEMKTKTLIFRTAGWIGTGLILTAYFLISNQVVTGDSLSYQIMNLFGALFLGSSLFVKKAWPAFTLQVAWSMIALWALAKLFLFTTA